MGRSRRGETGLAGVAPKPCLELEVSTREGHCVHHCLPPIPTYLRSTFLPRILQTIFRYVNISRILDNFTKCSLVIFTPLDLETITTISWDTGWLDAIFSYHAVKLFVAAPGFLLRQSALGLGLRLGLGLGLRLTVAQRCSAPFPGFQLRQTALQSINQETGGKSECVKNSQLKIEGN